jgi:membrane protein involved in colicin uptake
MAERQETSVMASIQDILRDAQLREEQDKVAAQRKVEEEERARLDAIRRQQEEEEARLQAEENARAAKIFEEQRKQAELAAMQEAAIQRARMEAEAQARLAEMAARQEHERQLTALTQDKHKKRLVFGLIGGSVVFLLVASIGIYELKVYVDKTNQLTAQLAAEQAEKDKTERERSAIQAKLDQTTDPEQIAQLKASLKEKQDKIDDLNKDITSNGKAGTSHAYGGGGGGPAPVNPGGVKPPPAPCGCDRRDPMCGC